MQGVCGVGGGGLGSANAPIVLGKLLQNHAVFDPKLTLHP